VAVLIGPITGLVRPSVRPSVRLSVRPFVTYGLLYVTRKQKDVEQPKLVEMLSRFGVNSVPIF